MQEMKEIINNIGKKPNGYDFIKNIEELKQNDFKLDPLKNFNIIAKNNLKQVTHFLKGFIKQFLEIDKIIQGLKTIYQKLAKWQIKNIKKQQPLNNFIELNGKQKSKKNYVGAIAFTADETKMIVGSQNKIQLWQFSNGVLKKDKSLEGHTSTIHSLVVNKDSKWLASGSIDGTIITWKCKENNEWQFKKTQSHESIVTCLILNKKEDELLSSSVDKKIIVWKVNCQDNQIQLMYKLNAKFCVIWMTMNRSETQLITFNMSSFIILWEKQIEWSEKSNLKIDGKCSNGCFIGENEFAIQAEQTDYIKIFSVVDLGFQQIEKFNLQQICECNNNVFHSMFNEKRQVLVHKCGKIIFIIKVKYGVKFFKPKINIDCGDENNNGILTKNGECLVLWSQKVKEFRIFQINYKA